MSLIYKGQIIANVGGSGGSSEEVYSTEETRIGTWIDGKPLYRKCFTGTALKTNSNSLITLDADFPNNNYLATIRGTAVFNKGKNTEMHVDMPVFPSSDLPYLGTNYMIWAFSHVGDGLGVSYRLAADVDFTIIVEYTKTTDEEVSP